MYCIFPFHDFFFLSWTSERLVGGSEERQLCAKVRKCNIEEKTRTKVTKVPERKCENIPYNRQVCRPEAVPQSPQMVSVQEDSYVSLSQVIFRQPNTKPSTSSSATTCPSPCAR